MVVTATCGNAKSSRADAPAEGGKLGEGALNEAPATEDEAREVLSGGAADEEDILDEVAS